MRLFALVFAAFASLCHAADFTGLVAFGDSLSDMGNRWIKSEDMMSKTRATWVKVLAGPQMLNVPGFKVSGITTWLQGSNYAVGGAGTAVTAGTTFARNRGQDLTVQVSQRYLNPAFNRGGVLPDALHVVVIGANDIMLASIGMDQILSQWATLDKVGEAVAKSSEGQIDALAKAGAKTVLWGNVLDLAEAPSVQKRAAVLPSLAPIYLAAVTKAVRAHNTEMDAACARLEKAHPTLKLVKLDLFQCFNEVAANPAKFGFTDVTTGANDDAHLFSADGLHPTPRGHRMLAEYAFRVLTEKVVSKTAQSP